MISKGLNLCQILLTKVRRSIFNLCFSPKVLFLRYVNFEDVKSNSTFEDQHPLIFVDIVSVPYQACCTHEITHYFIATFKEVYV